MLKNRNIGYVIWVITLIVCAVNLLAAVLYFRFLNITQIWQDVLFFAGMLLFNLWTLQRLLRRHITQKIEVIYRIILNQKKDPFPEGSKGFESLSLEKIGADAEQWSKTRTKEIDELKDLEEYRRNFVGNISHELKTPIFSIQGYLHTLLEGGMFDKKVNVKYLEKALANTERLQAIVEDMEVINKLQSKELPLKMTSFDLRSLFEEVFEDVKFMAREARIRLDFAEDGGKNYTVRADRKAILQVASNLIVNAIKYGKKGGKVEVSFHTIKKQVLTEITDDGIGIEQKHHKHLFDRFYRVDPSRSKAIHGTGLGLSIVKHILESHQQSIHIRSTVGKGTTFSFTLPLDT